jgi:hypothetical protein
MILESTVSFTISILSLRPQRAPARIFDWEAIQRFVDQDINQTRQSSPEFMSATNRWDQCYLVCALQHLQHRLAMPLFMIGRLFNVSKGAIW